MAEKQNQKKKVMILVLVLGLVLLTIGGTYAFFTYTIQGQKENTLTTGIMYFVYDELSEEPSNQINITNAFPISDNLGKSQEGEGVFEFQVRAKTQGADINYEIYLTKNTSTLPNKVVKTYLSTIAEKGGPVESETPINNQWTKQDVNLYSKLWNSSLPILNGAKAKTLEQATVPDSPEEYERTYRYRMWLDENANGVNNKGEWIYSNKTFSVNVNVYASNETLPPPTPPIEEATFMTTSYSTSWFKGTETTKDKVTKIEFVQSKIEPEETIESWDVSSSRNESIMAYLTKNSDGEDTYTVTIGSDAETVYMNYSSNNMFREFSGLKEIKGLELLGTSMVTDMSYMFGKCDQLKDFSFLENWDTSSVTDMSGMFWKCSQLTDLDLSGWDVSSVKDMSSMFSGCSQLIDLISISNWETSSLENMLQMFNDCSQLTDLDLSGWDVSSVTEMRNMFIGCSQLTTLDLSNWETSSVNEISSMFDGCSHLQSLDLSGWDVSSVKDMQSMFSGCNQLSTITGIADWDTSSVESMTWMFENSSQLSTTITIRGNVTSYSNMFYGAATADGASITVNYTDETETIVDEMIKTGGPNIHKGQRVESLV